MLSPQSVSRGGAIDPGSHEAFHTTSAQSLALGRYEMMTEIKP